MYDLCSETLRRVLFQATAARDLRAAIDAHLPNHEIIVLIRELQARDHDDSFRPAGARQLRRVDGILIEHKPNRTFQSEKPVRIAPVSCHFR
jgi:hypothetical protein